MPPSRNNENQPPHRGSGRTPFTPYRNAESRRVESNIRDVKPDIEEEEGMQAQTGPDQAYVGAVNISTLATHPDNTASPMSRMALLKLNTPQPPPTPGRTEDWVAQHGTPEGISLNTGPTGTPNRSVDPRRLRHPLPPRPPSPVEFYPSMATPGMAPSRDYQRGAYAPLGRSDGPLPRQIPSNIQSHASRGPAFNNDTPTSAYESGMEDQLRSPDYAADISPTNVMSSRVAEPLIAAAIPFNPTPTVQAPGSMGPPNFQSRNLVRRQTLSEQARHRPYPQTPGTQLQRVPRPASSLRNSSAPIRPRPVENTSQMLDYGGAGDSTALGNGHPGGAVYGRPRAESAAEIIQRYQNEGRPIPSVLQPAEPVGPILVTHRSGPTSPFVQFTPAPLVISTPRTTFPGEMSTPQVVVPGNLYAQTPTAAPGSATATDQDGNLWNSVTLPRWHSDQVGVTTTPGQVNPAARMLAAARDGAPSDLARPPRIPVPTPGDFHFHARVRALDALDFMADNDGANFADPAHFEIFEHYVAIALSEGTRSPRVNERLQILYPRFVHEMSTHAAYLKVNEQRIPGELEKSLEIALDRAISLWGNTSYITETFRFRLAGVQSLMAQQSAEQDGGAYAQGGMSVD